MSSRDMSEQQKFFASVSGAMVAHVVLLGLAFVWLKTSSVGSAFQSGTVPKEDQPQEVTILMSELMEKIEVEPEIPEPEPEPELEVARPFMDTDSNVPEAEAPELAKFESDRNTSASSELAPNLDLPRQEGPTLAGDSSIPYFELESREYTDGEESRPASLGSVPSSPQEPVDQSSMSLPPKAGFPSDLPGEELPNPEAKGGMDMENFEGVEEEPIEAIADRKRRPAGSVEEATAEEESVMRSFVDPNGRPETVLPEVAEGDSDQFSAISEDEAEVGEKADLEQEQVMASGKVGKEGESELESEADQMPVTEAKDAADAGIFAEGYSRERMQSSMNGSVSNLGKNAVDAEETAIGRYKKQVREAIGKKWYRYHTQYRDSVTWGVLKLKFRVDDRGKVHDLRVVKNESNTVLVEFSLRAIIDADIPAMPKEVAEELGVGGLDIDYDFIIY